MRCIKCGLLTSAPHSASFVCEDCKRFSPIMLQIWDEVELKMSTAGEIDPEADPIFRLLADTTFITASNPQVRVFYRVCEAMVSGAVKGDKEMTDVALTRAVRSTRGFSEVYRLFTDLDLIRVRNEPYIKVLVFQDKLVKMAGQFLLGKPISDQVTKRLAHIYAGYVLVSILSRVARIETEADLQSIPYGRRPQSLWTVLMFLWKTAYETNRDFMADDLRKFLSKRGIPTSTSGSLTRALQTLDGRTTQSMIKTFEPIGDDLKFTFSEYVIEELERIREIERTRQRV